jgi:Asp-tRNA(Asn)/Glu-tRNA(Gln) amidotransferase A subunit family amidase
VLDVKVRASMQGYDALLMAVAPTTAPKGLENTGDPSLLGPWTTLGYPAIALCTGISGEGLPLAVQMVGGPKADYHLLQVGAWCEKVLGTLPAPPIS